jgi:hypothetical protein
LELLRTKGLQYACRLQYIRGHQIAYIFVKIQYVEFLLKSVTTILVNAGQKIRNAFDDDLSRAVSLCRHFVVGLPPGGTLVQSQDIPYEP